LRLIRKDESGNVRASKHQQRQQGNAEQVGPRPTAIHTPFTSF
jgi:hypothetical protein